MSESLARRTLAELFGTFWLVFGGCGAAIFAAKQIASDTDGHTTFNIGIGYVGVALASGLAVLTMVYAVGHISGGHFNPAVTIGAVAAGRLPARDLVPYWIAQVAGGLIAGLVLWIIASGSRGFTATGNMAANGFGDHSPGGYSLVAVLVTEIILTAFLLIIILGATDKRAHSGFAGIAIGLTVTLVNLISIPISNTSVNPARSTGVAFFNGNGAPEQLWMFWCAPLVGGLIGGILYVMLFTGESLKLKS